MSGEDDESAPDDDGGASAGPARGGAGHLLPGGGGGGSDDEEGGDARRRAHSRERWVPLQLRMGMLHRELENSREAALKRAEYDEFLEAQRERSLSLEQEKAKAALLCRKLRPCALCEMTFLEVRPQRGCWRWWPRGLFLRSLLAAAPY